MKARLVLFVGLFGLVTFGRVIAQEFADNVITHEAAVQLEIKSINSLTLHDALFLAEKNNLDLLAVQEQRKIADGQYIEYRSRALPRLNLQAQYIHVDDITTIEMPDGAFHLGQLENYQVVAEVSQLICSGGSIGAALRIGKESKSIADRLTNYARSELAYQVHALFNGVLLAKENVVVAQDAVENAMKNQGDVKARLGQGLARKFDLLRAKELVSSRKADSIAAANELRKSRLRLFQVLNIPLNDGRSIVGMLRYEPVEPDVSNLVNQAIASRDDVIAASHAVKLQRNAIDLAKSSSRPQVGVFAETKYANPDRSFHDEWEASWMLGVRASVPLFDGYFSKGKILQETARLRQAELKMANLISMVKLDVTQATVDVDTADRLVNARNGNVVEAIESLRLAGKGYEEGFLQQIDVLNAQLSLTDSKRKYAQAVFGHIMAIRQLQRVTGKLIKTAAEPRK